MRHAGVHDVEGGDRGRCVRADNCRRLPRRRQGVDVLSPLPVALGHLRNRLGIGVLRDWSICSWWNRLFCMTPSRPARERSPEWLLVGNDRGGEAAASPALRTFRGTVTFLGHGSPLRARGGRPFRRCDRHKARGQRLFRSEAGRGSGGASGHRGGDGARDPLEAALVPSSGPSGFGRSAAYPPRYFAATQIDESFFPRPPVDESNEMPEHAVKSSRRPGNRVVEIPRQSAWQAAALERTS